MTVQELLEILQQYEPDMDVRLLIPDPFSGTFVASELTEQDVDIFSMPCGEEEDSEYTDVVVIGPTNHI